MKLANVKHSIFDPATGLEAILGKLQGGFNNSICTNFESIKDSFQAVYSNRDISGKSPQEQDSAKLQNQEIHRSGILGNLKGAVRMRDDFKSSKWGWVLEKGLDNIVLQIDYDEKDRDDWIYAFRKAWVESQTVNYVLNSLIEIITPLYDARGLPRKTIS